MPASQAIRSLNVITKIVGQAGFLLGLYLSHALTNQVLDLHECGFTHHSNDITAMTPDPSLVKGLACQSK